MKNIHLLKLTIYLIVFNLSSFVAKAQNSEHPGFPGEDPGAPSYPIDDWIVPMFILGVFLLFYNYKKYQKRYKHQQKVD
ncbi:hypothetical protein MCEGE10_00851 [Flavobacteriaceae bacterium]